jgi:hypothetical protein
VDSLKALDPEGPIREADMSRMSSVGVSSRGVSEAGLTRREANSLTRLSSTLNAASLHLKRGIAGTYAH